MTTNILAVTTALSDQELLARLDALATRERETTVELVAHLAALDSRPSLYAGQGFGSLFAYCVHTLRLSEDATCARIKAARACRRFPQILDLLASGALTLSSVRLLAGHLTPENHETVLDRACGRRLREIEALVAALSPRPDLPTSVRKLPERPRLATPSLPSPAVPEATSVPAPVVATVPSPVAAVAEPLVLSPPPVRPIVQAIAPARYRVQFTVGEETHEKLRRLQTLLRREIPDGDPAAIVERALSLLLERVEGRKLGARRRPPSAIRPATDEGMSHTALPPDPWSRHIPQDVKRAVWERDGGRCAFVSTEGRRCPERTFLEYHHVQLYALQGPATVENISLRCRRHNQHEAALVFGPRNGNGHRAGGGKKGPAGSPRANASLVPEAPHG